jgi:hypothetical protein
LVAAVEEAHTQAVAELEVEVEQEELFTTLHYLYF